MLSIVSLVFSLSLFAASVPVKAQPRGTFNLCQNFYNPVFQIGNFPKTVVPATTKDYRLYIYPDPIWNGKDGVKLIEETIFGITARTKTPLAYLGSVRQPTHLFDVAFFRRPTGEIFGVSHIDLFSGHLDLHNLNLSIGILNDIDNLIANKITEPSLDKMFAKMGFDLWRFNTRYETSDRVRSVIPLLGKTKEYVFYELPDSGNRLLAMRSFLSNDLKIEIIDVVKNPSESIKGEANGHHVHKKIIDEILDFVFPLYSVRRGWTPEFIESLRAKAHATAFSTKYIVVRDPTTNQILATMGLSRAPYGKAILRDTLDWQWKEVVGLFGSSIYENGLGPKIPTLDSFRGMAPILPMEGYLEGTRLPRPMVLELISRSYWNQKDIFGKSSSFADATPPSEFDPLYLGSGIIYEPTKFAIAKNLVSRQVSHEIVIRELFAAVFDLRYQSEFLNEGQYLYTYNDRKGIRLYEGMGFDLLDKTPISKDGTDWYVLGLSPRKMLQVVESKILGNEAASKEFSRHFEDQIISLLESGQN